MVGQMRKRKKGGQMIMSERVGAWIDGEEADTSATYPVLHKYTNQILAHVVEAGDAEVERALSAASRVFAKPLVIPERIRILEQVAMIMADRREQLARIISQEAGKPIKDARVEVDRGRSTLHWSAVAAGTLHGEEIPVMANPGVTNRLAFTLRKPFGPVLAITPFNFPLNLLLHKVGPALAVGSPVIAKPAPATPLTALTIARWFHEAGLPAGWLSVITGQEADLGRKLVADDRVRFISFTGSAVIGKVIRSQAGVRPVTLELGNNAANIVHADADLEKATKILAQRAFGFAGQVCIAVQRIYVDQRVYSSFTRLFEQASSELTIGDPENDATDIGPMINESAAERSQKWIDEAIAQGAVPLFKGTRNAAILPPTALTEVEPTMQVMREEAFAPVAGIVPYESFDQAIRWTNDTKYGLQAGVFTEDLRLAMSAARMIHMGGVIINDSSAYRVDNMPYGGVKESGVGREGPAYAAQDMTYPSVVVMNLG